MQDGLGRSWKEVADHHHAALVTELATAFDVQLKAALVEAVDEERERGEVLTEAARTQTREETLELTRRSVSDGLNQTLRRLRQAPSQGGVLTILSETTAPWSTNAAIAAILDETFRVVASRNVTLDTDAAAIDLNDAPALNSVVDSTDPLVAIAAPSEISEPLSDAFGAQNRVHLLPVHVRGAVTAVLIVSGEVVTGALELLTEAAGMRLEVLNPALAPALKPLPTTGLVQISSAPGDESSSSVKWEDLSADEQKAHLAAQRIARVRVAEIRLYHADVLRQGVFAGNIYERLREQIDAARKEFLQNCLSQSSTMVDYLHLEILRSLAHDEERLLGSDYPGPMV